IERADKTPSLITLINIVNALDITTDMILCDVLNEHYQIKSSLVFDKVSKLSEEEQNRIYDIINLFL
ncbi:MAG: XRE family transcriptional regulator, partial [Ruminococcus sp.]|nr:XRE family transcriptional regulator [Ruminococcus sp.]